MRGGNGNAYPSQKANSIGRGARAIHSTGPPAEPQQDPASSHHGVDREKRSQGGHELFIGHRALDYGPPYIGNRSHSQGSRCSLVRQWRWGSRANRTPRAQPMFTPPAQRAADEGWPRGRVQCCRGRRSVGCRCSSGRAFLPTCKATLGPTAAAVGDVDVAL